MQTGSAQWLHSFSPFQTFRPKIIRFPYCRRYLTRTKPFMSKTQLKTITKLSSCARPQQRRISELQWNPNCIHSQNPLLRWPALLPLPHRPQLHRQISRESLCSRDLRSLKIASKNDAWLMLNFSWKEFYESHHEEEYGHCKQKSQHAHAEPDSCLSLKFADAFVLFFGL